MADRDPDCPFCGIVAGDIPARVVASDEEAVAFMDLSPATPGHVLVVPRRHAKDLLSVADADLAATVRLARRVAAAQVERLGAEGVNLLNNCGARAWQTVHHLHVHVIPRYADDGLVLPWQPTPGDDEAIAAAHASLTGS